MNKDLGYFMSLVLAFGLLIGSIIDETGIGLCSGLLVGLIIGSKKMNKSKQ